MHRAHGAQQLGICELKERRALAEDLRGIYRAPTAEAGRELRRALEPQVRRYRQAVAKALGRHQSAVCVTGRDPARDLHQQRGRIAAHDTAQGDQDRGLFSKRGVRAQAAVSGAAQHRATLASGAELADFVESLPAAMGRPDRGGHGKGRPLTKSLHAYGAPASR